MKPRSEPELIYKRNVIARIIWFLSESFVMTFTAIFILMAVAGILIYAYEEKSWTYVLIAVIILVIAFFVFKDVKEWLLDIILSNKTHTGIVKALDYDYDIGDGNKQELYEVKFKELSFFVPEKCWRKLSVGNNISIVYTPKRKRVIKVERFS